jgi:hypothetical protein
MTARYDGPMTMRTGLAKSKNMISIRILQAVGPKTAQEWVSTRFGFEADKHPAYLTMALGAGSVTPAADGIGVFGVCQWRLPRQPLAHHKRDRPQGSRDLREPRPLTSAICPAPLTHATHLS